VNDQIKTHFPGLPQNKDDDIDSMVLASYIDDLLTDGKYFRSNVEGMAVSNSFAIVLSNIIAGWKYLLLQISSRSNPEGLAQAINVRIQKIDGIYQ